MKIFVAVANESNFDYNWHGRDHFYLVKSKTPRSAKSRLHKSLQKQWNHFKYEVSDEDVSNYLIDMQKDEKIVGINMLNFINSTCPGAIEIDAELYGQIIKQCKIK